MATHAYGTLSLIQKASNKGRLVRNPRGFPTSSGNSSSCRVRGRDGSLAGLYMVMDPE